MPPRAAASVAPCCLAPPAQFHDAARCLRYSTPPRATAQHHAGSHRDAEEEVKAAGGGRWERGWPWRREALA
nr:unnamed protein product [Digitaria exilis]